MSGQSFISVSGDGRNELIKELLATFEKAEIPADVDSAENLKTYRLTDNDSSLSVTLDSGEMAVNHPEVYPPQSLSLFLDQNDFAYTAVLSGKASISIFNIEIVNALIAAYEKAGHPIQAVDQRGKKLQTANLRCVSGGLSMNPRVSTNCVLTVNSR